MKSLNCLGICLALALLCMAPHSGHAEDTQISVDLGDVEQAKCVIQIDSIRTIRIDSAAQVMADYIDSLFIDSTLTAEEVSVLPDATDPHWVQIDVPLLSSTGYAYAFWVGVIQEFVEDGGQVLVAGRVRMQYKNAIRRLQRLSVVLQNN